MFCFEFRKKQRTTSDYIYHTLFVNGQDSDITLVALGKLTFFLSVVVIDWLID